jgi:hypothetical protein
VRVTDPTGLQGVAGGTAGVAAAQPGPGGPAGQPGAGGSAGDHVAPVLSNLRLSPKLFTARRGSRVSYRLSEKARLTVVLKRARHRNGRLVFTRYASAGRAAAEGSNAMRLRRRLGSRRLAPGRYRLTLVAVDAAANRSKPLSAKLTIRR